MSSTLDSETQRLAEVQLRRLSLRREQVLALSHPAYLLDRMEMIDEKTGEHFEFHLLKEGPEPSQEIVPWDENGWYWQRDLLNRLLSEQKTIILKARQIGVTWLCAAFQLAEALRKPGTLHLVYRQKEEDAAEIIDRIWTMFRSLPLHLRFGVKVLTPFGGRRPHTLIELEHPDGRVSRIRGMASTPEAGHGQTVATVLLDEAARIEKLSDIWTAITSTVGTIGKVFLVSTANGVSDESTGEGNYFHYLWIHAEEKLLNDIFLGWFVHPDRDAVWYEQSPEIRALDIRARAEQYPSTAEEAFKLTTDTYFDPEAIEWYQRNGIKQPLYRFDWEAPLREDMTFDPSKARKNKSKRGRIRVYQEPNAEHRYAIGADVATGRGADSSAAYVVDLHDMSLVAEFHGKINPDRFAYQLHYLGRWYYSALIAVDRTTGWGEAVLVPLRDGREGRPAYPKLYRHVLSSRADLPEAKPFGIPMNTLTRPLVISQLERALRDHSLPWLTSESIREISVFVHHQTGTSPRAMNGSSDDCVMALCIALEMFRLYGHHPNRRKRTSKREVKTPYPWMAA